MTTDTVAFSVWMTNIQERTETSLARLLPPATKHPARLHRAMRYATLAGGKRIRPLLCHAAGTVVGAPPDLLDLTACAVEFIHVYSLVHDDLPAMDNDVLRRGKATCHVEFDEATAILAGDALQTLAFETLSLSLPGIATERQVTMIHLLAEATGARGMAGGQAIDLAAVNNSIDLAELEYMHVLKTGALIRAAVLLGAQCGSASDETLDVLGRYAHRAGLLFQVVDDILDAEADTATLGKTAGKDQATNKPTFYSLLGPAGAKDFAASLLSDSLGELQSLGTATRHLEELTKFIARRHY